MTDPSAADRTRRRDRVRAPGGGVRGMRAVIAAALALLLPVAACDRAPAPAPTAAATATADRAADAALLARIEALPPGQRDLVLFRAIRDAGQGCQGIAAAARIEPVQGRPAWSAQCDDRARFLLVLQPGGRFWVTARGFARSGR